MSCVVALTNNVYKKNRDGTGSGFDMVLIESISKAVKIPVIASSGAGCVQHFSEVKKKK